MPRQHVAPPRRTAAAAAPHAAGATQFTDALVAIDPQQAAMMEEQCILVDREDRPLGPATKVATHLCSEGLPLHRAFSIFIFDSEGRMLLQRRAACKHTFPLYWTNACCSHPLWTNSEMGIEGAPLEQAAAGGGGASVGAAAVLGGKRAAVRKLAQEVGIPEGQLPPEAMHFMTRIHYRAESDDGVWGEHELDYIYAARVAAAGGGLSLAPNPNEVAEVAYVTREELRDMLAQADAGELQFTPWSRHIIDEFAFEWWDGVDDLASLADGLIHRVGECA